MVRQLSPKLQRQHPEQLFEKRLYQLFRAYLSDIGKQYITVKMEYIDSVCNFSKDMLTNFKHLQDKSMKAFVEILASNVAVSGEKIDNLLKEEERLLEEIKNMVEKK